MKNFNPVVCMHIMQHHLMLNAVYGTFILIFLIINSKQLYAQYWTVDTAFVNMDGAALVNPIDDFAPCDLSTVNNTYSFPLLEILPPFALEPTLKRYLETEVGNPTGTNCFSLAEGVGKTSITGYNTSDISMEFKAFATAKFGGECVCIFVLAGGAPPYFYRVSASSDYNSEVVLKAEGFAPSSTVTAYFSATVYTWVVNKMEDVADDIVTIGPTSVEIGGSDLFTPGAFNILGADIDFAENRKDYNGFVIFNSDSLLTISVSAFVSAFISDQNPLLYPPLINDKASVEFTVLLTLSLVEEPNYPTVNTTDCPPEDEALLFSLDIGSDTEIGGSASGDEYFDPGDMYAWKSSIPILPFNGYIDDANFFAGVDYPMDPTGILGDITCSGISIVPTDYFDLDAFDAISIDLNGYPFLPGNPFLNSGIYYPCIYLPEYITVSFDEDNEYDYANGSPDCSVPVFSSQPLGSSFGYDEIYADYSPINIYSTLNPQPLLKAPFIDEVDLHPGLSPNPDPFLAVYNDDVDALDFLCITEPCDYYYYSVDHEATGADAFLNPLDPGIIYSNIGGVPTPVILPDVLGLSSGVDIDAFEFCWLIHPTYSQIALALLFSVNADDPLTVLDESSGLSPGYIYGSFMEFSNFPLLTTYSGNIDAIGISAYPIITNHMQVEAVASADTICRDEKITLQAKGADYYEWSPDLWLSATSGNTVMAKPKSTITYTVVGYKGGGTKIDSAEITITVIPKPGVLVTTGSTTEICPGDSVVLTANSYVPLQYRWTRNGVQITGATSDTYVAYLTGDYAVRVRNAEGCRNVSNIITVDDCAPARYAAVEEFIITPNPGDGKFRLAYYNSSLDDVTVKLYSSNGMVVKLFETITANSENDFDLDLPAGMYYFVAINAAGTQHIQKYIVNR